MKTEQILQLVEAVSGFGLDEFEYEEEITINTTQKWKERLYLIDNDYGIIFFYPMEAVQK